MNVLGIPNKLGILFGVSCYNKTGTIVTIVSYFGHDIAANKITLNKNIIIFL